MVDDVFLDMDETILDFTKAERLALRRSLEEAGIAPKEEILRLYHEINLSQWKLLEEGKLTRSRLKVRRFELLAERLGLAFDPAVLAARYEKRLGQGAYYKEGARETLERLRGNYRLYLLSNGSSRVQHGRIAAAGLEVYFDGIYISEDVGADKPDPRYFQRCFSDIERTRGYAVDPAKGVMTGDRLSSDIAGGKAAGLRTVWLNEEGKPAEGCRPDHIIGSVAELPELLARL